MKVERLFDIPYFQLEQYPNEKMFSYKKEGTWHSLSTKDFIKKVNLVSKGLIEYGIKPDDKIAIVSPNRYEWNCLDIAIQQVGAIVIPIYPNISTKDYRYIFNDAKIKIAFLGTEELFEKISSIRTEIPSLEEVYTYDKVNGAKFWEDIFDESDTHEAALKERKAAVKYEEMATIIYTSGTTGDPKGVMLSHKNILSNVEASIPLIPADEMSRVLTFLPVCHVYERMLHYLYMKLGASIYFAESLDTIGENIKEVKPHVFTAVPRLLEKVYDKIIAKGSELTGIKHKLFFWAVELAKDYNPQGNSFIYNIKLGIARKLIFSKWMEALGGEVKAIASGSAALSPQLCRIYLAAGINILEGYGLTETSPVISVNNLTDGPRIGTVGRLLKDVQVKIAEDGEILVKGPNVMLGYYGKPDKTAEEFDAEGWFHTGDIGEMVEGTFLKITDRKKEIFKTSGGKYIIPQPMENKFKESRFIEQIIVIGEGQKFPAALIVPSFPFVKEWSTRKEYGLEKLTNEEIIKDERLIARIQEEVDGFNKLYGHWETIKQFRLLPNEFTIEGNELTPTLKFKRKVIMEKYKDIVATIYTE